MCMVVKGRRRDGSSTHLNFDRSGMLRKNSIVVCAEITRGQQYRAIRESVTDMHKT